MITRAAQRLPSQSSASSRRSCTGGTAAPATCGPLRRAHRFRRAPRDAAPDPRTFTAELLDGTSDRQRPPGRSAGRARVHRQLVAAGARRAPRRGAVVDRTAGDRVPLGLVAADDREGATVTPPGRADAMRSRSPTTGVRLSQPVTNRPSSRWSPLGVLILRGWPGAVSADVLAGHLAGSLPTARRTDEAMAGRVGAPCRVRRCGPCRRRLPGSMRHAGGRPCDDPLRLSPTTMCGPKGSSAPARGPG